MNARTTVHPRVCGERILQAIIANTDVGSSPRVRGTLLGRTDTNIKRRFIPACAGNAQSPPPLAVLLSGSSPRVRGTLVLSQAHDLAGRFIPACAGNAASCLFAQSRACGSSPRVRGTLPRDARPWRGKRFIPACAGNARAASTAPAKTPVHPRVCGERPCPPRTKNSTRGSSPRVRGTLQVSEHSVEPCRFIPACAGNARSSAARE